MERSDRLLILAHGGSWEKRFQITSLAASEAASERSVDIALFFAALNAWAGDHWDEIDPSPPLDPHHVERQGLPALSSMLDTGRQQGLISLYACSASLRLLALDAAAVQARVDAIVGWQSFSRMIRQSSRVVTL